MITNINNNGVGLVFP